MLGQETQTAWCPDWYAVVQAAKYLGCKPWELMDMPVWWLDRALIAMTAENQAREILDRHQR